MKTVFSNKELTHVFVNQGQETGRNSGGSMFFEGRKFYSYGYHFLAAQIYDVKDGKQIMLVNEETYSPSTARHLSQLRSATYGHDRINCYSVFDPANIERSLNEKAGELGERFLKLIGKRGGSPIDWDIKILVESVEEFNEVCEAFGLESFKIEFHQENLDVLNEKNEEIKARIVANNTPEMIAAREAKKAAKEAAEQKRQAELKAEAINEFKAGSRSSVWGLTYELLRVDGNEVVTTGGARVPLDAAKRLLEAIEAGVDVAGFSIGYYRVDSVTDTVVQIGCHKIELEEARKVLKGEGSNVIQLNGRICHA